MKQRKLILEALDNLLEIALRQNGDDSMGRLLAAIQCLVRALQYENT